MLTNFFNVITIGALFVFIVFVTAFFFLGSQEDFQTLLLDMPANFFKRLLLGVFIGLLGSVIVTLGNLLLDRNNKNRKKRLIKIALLTLLLSAGASAAGTTFFFYH